jgi:hypothetical protein
VYGGGRVFVSHPSPAKYTGIFVGEYVEFSRHLIHDLGFRVQDLGLRIKGLGFSFEGSGSRV